MLMPVQGGLLYLMWGNKRPAIPLRRRMERAEAELAPCAPATPPPAPSWPAATLAWPRPPITCKTTLLRLFSAAPPSGITPWAM